MGLPGRLYRNINAAVSATSSVLDDYQGTPSQQTAYGRLFVLLGDEMMNEKYIEFLEQWREYVWQFSEQRSMTEQERKAYSEALDSVATPTDINIWDMVDGV